MLKKRKERFHYHREDNSQMSDTETNLTIYYEKQKSTSLKTQEPNHYIGHSGHSVLDFRNVQYVDLY